MDEVEQLKLQIADLEKKLSASQAELRMAAAIMSQANEAKDPAAKANNRLKCSFCGKSQDQVKKLISGPGVYVCDECVGLCNEILDEELFETHRLDPNLLDDYKGSPDSALFDAASSLMTTVFKTSGNYVVTRVECNLDGIRILVDGSDYGASSDERVLYASALELLVNDKWLIHCGSKENESHYQMTWSGLCKVKKWMKENSDGDKSALSKNEQ